MPYRRPAARKAPPRRKRAPAKKSNLLDGAGGGITTLVKAPWMPVFPPTITKRMRYSESFTGSCTAGAITSTQMFRANDLFDPNLTGTGHQPMGFDQLMLWYNHAFVVWSKITCVFKNTAATIPTVCIRMDADSGALTDYDRIKEFGGCVTETLEVKGSYGANKSLSLTADICKLQGVKRSNITSCTALSCTAAASPAEVSYYHVTMWDTTAASGSMQVDVVIEYIAQFCEPRDLNSS